MPQKRKRKHLMSENKKDILRKTLKGSWFDQDSKTSYTCTDTGSENYGVSYKKIGNVSFSQSSNSSSNRLIVDIDVINNSLKGMTVCKFCKTGNVSVIQNEDKRLGLSSSLIWKCENSDCLKSHEIHSSKTCDDGKTPEINRALVLGMRAIGKGRDGACRLLGALDLPSPPTQNCYSEHIKTSLRCSKQPSSGALLDAANRLRNLKGACNEEVIDCGVTIDGSWLNRGTSSKHGIVSVISIDTGEVLDYHYMCSVCRECEKWQDKASKEFLDWFVGHETNCNINYEGSSQNMETEGASILFNRSVEKFKIRYNPFIGDGDSKAFSRVTKEKPYGPDHVIVKEECVGHVQKRMGSRLRNLLTRSKGQKLYDGKPLSGHGRLTLAMVDSFQTWYGQAIRNNKGNVDKMSNETLAILLHYSEKADHSLCPTGEGSWCKWQSDKVTGQNMYQPADNPLAPAVVDAIRPVFDALSNKELMKGCANCLTQNQNESLHNCVWKFVPKNQFHSANEVELGIRLGVLQFNIGFVKMTKLMFEACDVRFTNNMENQFGKFDKRRVYDSVRMSTDSYKQKRKTVRNKKRRRTDAFRHSEGTTYKSGMFHGGKKATPKCKKCGNIMKGHRRGKCS